MGVVNSQHAVIVYRAMDQEISVFFHLAQECNVLTLSFSVVSRA